LQAAGAQHIAATKICQAEGGQFSQLPGDPTIILFTNVTLGDKKKGFMTALSKAVVASTGKPESYVAVCVQMRC
jgi:hypothetical protein